MDVSDLLEAIRSSRDYAGQIAHVRELPKREGRYGDLQAELSEKMQAVLGELGIARLYTHQTEAVNLALAGENVVIVAATASGKTLCYTIPIAEAIYERGTSRAFLIFPTKALAQDQLRKLEQFGAGTAFAAGCYDGDTPQSDRRRMRRESQVILTNPDMLHIGILPYHQNWAELFRNLRYVVLDEMHVYRGVFGSHTANVLRRLRRIARHYGADPQFICCSATIGNPRELAERLLGVPAKLVDDDGAPQGAKHFVLWNPPLMAQPGEGRRSPNMEAARLMATLVRRGVRSITFTIARQVAELILRYAREALKRDKGALGKRIASYRAGYLPKERREIERQLFEGDLLGVTTTTALELGIDVGSLEAAILTGYPGSIASTWQQAGRAGRTQADSLAILVALNGAVDQYIMRTPDYLFQTASEQGIVDPHNKYILAGHLLCAAYELPLQKTEVELFGQQMEDILEILAEARYVVGRQTKWYWIGDGYPAAQISIRSGSGEAYDIVDEDVSTPGRVVPGEETRPGQEGRLRSAEPGEVLHEPAGDVARARRGGARPAGDPLHDGALRRGARHGASRGLPEATPARRGGDEPGDARPAAAGVRHDRLLDSAGRGDTGGCRGGGRTAGGRDARARALHDRVAAADRSVRSARCGGSDAGEASGSGRGGAVHLRWLPGRRGDCGGGIRGASRASAGRRGYDRELPV